MTLTKQVLCLGKVQVRAFSARMRHNFRNSRLMCATIGLFLVAYLVLGYFMFARGFGYMTTVPGVGRLLLDRVVYMVFFFFFIMLVFSNAVLLYGALFRGKEIPWLFTLPVSPRAIFLWKIVESFFVSSWGLAILSSPLLLALSHILQAPPGFFLKCLTLYVPFMVLPATLAAVVVMILVRYWGRVFKALFWVAGGLAIAFVVWGWSTAQSAADLAEMADVQVAMKQLLGHSEMAMSYALPSAWMAELVLFWGRGYQAHGLFYGGLLLSWALMLAWLCVVLVSRLNYTAWSLSQRRRAMKTGRKRSPEDLAGDAIFLGPMRGVKRIPGISRTRAALIMKDLREFSRDPAQWIPCVLVFGLLFLYAANLNRAAARGTSEHFGLVLKFLNFGVCCLTLSTLTTRFIFPMFSLEGRRLWILGLSPVGMVRVFWHKYVLFAGAIAVITCLLMLLSGFRLGMAGGDLLVYCGGIVCMSLGLTALSLGLGVLFPNFEGGSPAKIVSGFGGTLCLILNFVFIISFMTAFVLPSVWKQMKWIDPESVWMPWITAGSLAVMAGVSFLAIAVPIFLSLKRMKRLELLGKL